jgi:hypothetical protein
MTPPAEFRPTPTDGETLAHVRLSDVEMRSIRFADRPLLQYAAFHLLAGRKGVGKGTYLADVIARVTRGELGPKRNVVVIASEDSLSIDIKPRVAAAGGDPERVRVVTDWVQLPRDVDKLSNTIREISDVGAVVIDPVGNHITGKNSNGDTDIRDAISQLNVIADQHDLILIGVRHLTQKEISASSGALAAILGSSAWVQLPRAVIVIARDDEDPDICHIQCVEGNRLPAGTPGRSFRIEGATLQGLDEPVTRVSWLGESAKDIEDLVARRPASRSGSARARELILDLLEDTEDGRRESDQLDADVVRETGLALQTIRNIRSQLAKDRLVRSEPEKDEHGALVRWYVVRTNERRSVSGGPDTGSSHGYSANGSTTPHTFQVPTHPHSVSGDNARVQIPTSDGRYVEPVSGGRDPDAQLSLCACGSDEVFAVSGRCKRCGMEKP